MELVCTGMNHRTDSIQKREAWTLPSEKVSLFLNQITRLDGVGGAVYLATCNRVELIMTTESGKDLSLPTALWKSFLETPPPGEWAYIYYGKEAFSHLLRVASGLDAMVLGETEILGQVKKAYAQSLAQKCSGSLLNFTFQQILRLAKKIRNQTGIARTPTSVSTVAISLLTQVFGDFRPLTGLVLGLGEMGRQVVKMASDRGVGKLYLINRTVSKALAFAKQIPVDVLSYADLSEALGKVDFVVTSTGSPNPIIKEAPFSVRGKGGPPIVLIDLGLPRDIDAALGGADNIYLYNIDDLKTLADKNRALRHREVRFAENMVQNALDSFAQEWSKRGVLTNRLVLGA